MTKRYIFLDFDGVINTLSNKYRRAERLLPQKDDLGPFFDLEAVKNLDELIAETGTGNALMSDTQLHVTEPVLAAGLYSESGQLIAQERLCALIFTRFHMV